MKNLKKLIKKAKEFDKSHEKKEIERHWKIYEKFLSLYPFKKNPAKINSLTPNRIYNPGSSKDYFLTWVEHKLKPLGHLSIGSSAYAESAKKNDKKFRELLKKVVDKSLSIAEKVDADWESIKWWGLDKNVAKKIIWCYNSNKILPIFKTEDLEYFINLFNIDFQKESKRRYKKEYDSLTLGERFELLNILLMKFKNSISYFKKWDIYTFARFLYYYSKPETRRAFESHRLQQRESKPFPNIGEYGLLSEPQTEQEVIFLFAQMYKSLGFLAIKRLSVNFPDAKVIDNKKDDKTIEFEYRASNFDHPPTCDYIICWENDLTEKESKKLPKIISLKEFIEKSKN